MNTQDTENTRKESTQKESTQKENTPKGNIQKKQTDNPHDKGYKRIFSIKRHFLHFIKKYIALEWMMALEEEDLELIDKEFITDQFDTYVNAAKRNTGFQPLCPLSCITVNGTGLHRVSSAR